MTSMRMIVVAIFMVFTFTAIAASTAFAGTEYLESGAVETPGALLKSEGELLIADRKGGVFGEEVMVLCSMEGLAEMLSASDFAITSIYPLGGTDPVLGSGTLSCVTQAGTCPSPTAVAVGLDWSAELRAEESTPEIALTGESSPGWEVTCSGVKDACTAPAELVEVKNETNGTLDTSLKEAPSNCARGGTEAGRVEGLLTFSSEAGLSIEAMAPPPEAQKILLTPIQNGGKCPETEGKVVFTVVEEKCEYTLKNDNAFESIEVRTYKLGIQTICEKFTGNCFLHASAVSSPECLEPGWVFSGTTLAPGGVCYATLEYMWRPSEPSSAFFEIGTLSTGGGVAKTVVNQSLK